ncbi:protein NLP4-like isoform X2 [Prunus yedoensis var. nudiflora]|uniref:Protein NLP4-like isoform X2 n=1 Tax=Prunus yedoensis var. nudiflora TaxID=2094558 RepID=A0A314YZ62_PRUYE|nr:protein NLP4-like isoform X2 [Prunus yedoensis var. nudiflora]
MDDDVLSPATMMGTQPDSATDLDFMDELFLEGCWLETTDGPEFPNQSHANSGAHLNPSVFWHTLEANGNLTMNPSENSNQEVIQTPFFKQLHKGPVNPQFPSQNMIDVDGYSGHSADPTIKSYELNRRWWIGPLENQGPASSVMERLTRALVCIRDVMRDKNVLVQVWVPVNKGGRNVLTTNDDLFSLILAVPGFPNIEKSLLIMNSQLERILQSWLRGCPAGFSQVRFLSGLLMFDSSEVMSTHGLTMLNVMMTCLGVIEVVTTTQKTKYQHELESVCKALEDVDLQSSRNWRTQNVKGCVKPYQAALPEIQEVLRSACETHKLPLAQTWVSCVQQGKDGCRHSDDNYVHCVSTLDHAFHVTDPYIEGFHEACSEHHLLKGQGIVGKAFMTNQPCFSDDITSCVKTEYPLSHHARMFGLHAAVAIRLRSMKTGSTDYVLEFFLPVECRDPEEQKKMLNSLSLIIQQICRSLRVVTDKELEEESDFPISEKIVSSDPRPSGIASFTEVQLSGNDVSIFPMENPREVLGVKSSNLKDAANSIGVCSTTLKRICRQHGIKRWPSRKIKKVGHSLQKLQLVIDSVEGASGAFQINSFYTNFPELTSPNLSRTSPFSTSKLSDQPKPTNLSPEGGVVSPQATASKSPSSSCGQSSSSSQCCSSRTQQHPPTCNVTGDDDPIVGDNSGDGVLKRVRSEAELHAFGQDRTQLLPRSQSHKILNELQKLQPIPPSLKNNGVAQEREVQRVKVAYGDEKTRFRMRSDWRYEDLVQEIAKRFSIEDISNFDIKYLDDDSEWVLLTCDADLEECIDVCRSSQSHTIKLSLHLSRHHLRRFIRIDGPS